MEIDYHSPHSPRQRPITLEARSTVQTLLNTPEPLPCPHSRPTPLPPLPNHSPATTPYPRPSVTPPTPPNSYAPSRLTTARAGAAVPFRLSVRSIRLRITSLCFTARFVLMLNKGVQMMLLSRIVYMSVCLNLSIFLFLCLSVCRSVVLSLCRSVVLSFCRSVVLSVCPLHVCV